MRLFIFAIGGTGCRVMKSLAMLCAAGVRPVDPSTGKPMEDFEIVPVIIDPHHSNADLQRTDSILRSYRKIRNRIYGESHSNHGFFSAKISTLGSLARENRELSPDTFLFNLSDVERARFCEYIDYNNLNEQNQALMSILFSPKQMQTSMNIGFVGAPNIGAVALNKFKDSVEFKAFANIFTADDRIFFISSIFGGTGAAGFPIMVKNIRQANELNITNRASLSAARIGALTVLPYFNLEHSDDSPINKSDFILKTQSALHYYDTALTGQSNRLVDSIYYIGDKVLSSPYANDPGAGGQKNAAHLVELIGALSPIEFAETADDSFNNNAPGHEYALETDSNTVDFTVLSHETRNRLFMPMLKMHLLSLFLDNRLTYYIGRGFTKDTPCIGKDFLSSDFYKTLTGKFLSKYWDWIEEMDSNNRHVSLFDLNENARLESILINVEVKRGVFRRKTFTYDEIFASMNALSKRLSAKYPAERLPLKLLDLFDRAVSELIPKKYSNII